MERQSGWLFFVCTCSGHNNYFKCSQWLQSGGQRDYHSISVIILHTAQQLSQLRKSIPYFTHKSPWWTLQWRHNEHNGVSNHQPHDVYLSVYWGADQRKHQSSVSLAFVRGIHRWTVNSPHKGASNAENVSIWWHHHGWAMGWLLRVLWRKYCEQFGLHHIMHVRIISKRIRYSRIHLFA